MSAVRFLSVLAALTLGTVALARSTAPSQRQVAGMSLSELRAIEREYSDAVESIRTTLLSASVQSDISAVHSSIPGPRQEIKTILAGLTDQLEDGDGKKDDLEELEESFKDMRRCLKTMKSDTEGELADLESLFGSRYGQGTTLKSWINDDTSGEYKRLLLTLCGY